MTYNFDEFYSEHKGLVYNLALQYAQNVEDAEEIMQDVFLAAHQNLGGFREDSSVKTWLYRISINKSLDFLKAKSAQKRWTIFRSKRLDDVENTFQPANFNHPGVELEQKEAMEKIFACINKLPEQQKTALILLKIEQLPGREVAEIMQLSEKAVESLFSRAKKNLKEMLEQREGI
jgi:RNA polymerase sigma factor (sigma-70 family)